MKNIDTAFKKIGLLALCITVCACGDDTHSDSDGGAIWNGNPDIEIELIGATVSGQTDENATVLMQGGNSDSAGTADTVFALEQFSGVTSQTVNATTTFTLSETLSASDAAANQRDYALDVQIQQQ